MTIRKVQPADVSEITEIYNYYIEHSTATFDTCPYTLEHMREVVEGISAHHPYFVCEDGGKILGYSYAHPWKEREAYRFTAESTVYVSPRHTKEGIGQALTRSVIKACREAGYHALIACITAENEASARMHEKLGFQKVSTFGEVGFKFGRWLGIADYELML